MRQNGTVKFFNQAKGYGFVSPENGGKDVFVHITAVQRSGIPELSEGLKISFEVQEDQRAAAPRPSICSSSDGRTEAAALRGQAMG